MGAPFLFWGPHFPDAAGVKKYWSTHFPDPGLDPSIVRPVNPQTVSTLALVFDTEVKVTWAWGTDVFKARDGRENRTSWRQEPVQRFAGQSMMVGDGSRATRTRMAEHAALGSAFNLALPYEETRLVRDASGQSVFVHPTTPLDWLERGLSVVVVANDRTQTIGGVIQAVTSEVISGQPVRRVRIGATSGTIGKAGGYLMPAVPVFLDPRQPFTRYPAKTVESWKTQARSASFWYSRSAIAAKLSLADPVTIHNTTQGVVFQHAVPGFDGNGLLVQMHDDSLSGVDVDDDGVSPLISIHFQPGISTLGELYTAISTASTRIQMIGTWVAGDLLIADDSEFNPLPLAGGYDEGRCVMGNGATVAMHDGKPLWDRPIHLFDTATDSVQAMTEVADLGGKPTNYGVTRAADFGRHLALRARIDTEYQWVKAFLDTIKGSWRSFYLSTWREDLVPVSINPGSAAVAARMDMGDWAESGALDGMELRYTPAGAAGNGYTITFSGDAISPGGELEEYADETIVRFIPGVTNANQITVLFAGHTYLTVYTGPATPLAVLQAADDEFSEDLAGGADAVSWKLVIQGPSTATGDFFAWYPSQRQHLQIRQVDGTVFPYKILDAEDMGGNAITLSLDGVEPDDIDMVSWLELVRLESDEVALTFKGTQFTFETVARGVQR